MKFVINEGKVAASGNVMSLIDPTCKETTIPCDKCFQQLFYDCTNLTAAPKLPATTVTKSCYYDMFYLCKALETAPELPATTLADGCYSFMFYSCEALKTAPELPATTLAESCYDRMFYGCTSLTTAPELPAPILTATCYRYMFSNCSSLTSITCLATNLSATNCTQNWISNSNFQKTGTFTKAKGADWTSKTGNHGIPSGWTVKEPTKGTATRTGDVEVKWVQLWADGPKFAENNVADKMLFADATKTGDNFVWGANWCTPSKEDMDELLLAATSTGSDKVNDPLSVNRANSVAQYLAGQGTSSQIRDVLGFGSRQPVADNTTTAGKAANRRVEIYIYASEKMIKDANAGKL